MTLKVRPIGDKVLVEPLEEKEEKGKKGGIIIPDTAKEKPMAGVVMAVDTGKTGDDGKQVPIEVKEGDHLLVSKFSGAEIKLEGKDFRILNSDDKRRKGNEGYNVATNEYEDLVKAGVVDPKKVTRAALQNAGSIAGLLLTTECLVTEIPAEEKSGSAPGG